jgi:hypothetical protein
MSSGSSFSPSSASSSGAIATRSTPGSRCNNSEAQRDKGREASTMTVRTGQPLSTATEIGRTP